MDVHEMRRAARERAKRERIPHAESKKPCVVHRDYETSGACRECHRGLCSTCREKDKLCPDCAYERDEGLLDDKSQGGFCGSCVASSRDQAAGNTYLIRGWGTTLYGSADKCPTCDSVVTTKWFTAFRLPVIPLGSYRWLEAEEAGFFTRATYFSRAVALRGDQVITGWVISAVILIALFLFVVLTH
jgi:hypothetical protein